MSNLADIMELVSGQLKANIEASRQSFLHNATKGDAVENAVRSFLRRHLPDAIGVAHGQVADRFGNVSTQLDVILYDAQRTPILYMDEAKENRLIPAEGVIAAIECKTNLRLDELRTLAKSAETLKSLDRSAYYKSSEVFISKVVRAYGREWDVIPPMYFVLAFDGPALDNLAHHVAAENSCREVHKRIDMVAVLNRGAVVNQEPDGMIDALPTPNSQLIYSQSNHVLFLFYVLMTRWVLQADIPPIAIQRYMPVAFVFTSTD